MDDISTAVHADVTMDDLVGRVVAGISSHLETQVAPVTEMAQTDLFGDIADHLRAARTAPADLSGSVLEEINGEWRSRPMSEVSEELAIAEMGQGILVQLEKPFNNLVPNVKMGSIVLGGVGGLLVGEVLDGFITPRTDEDKTNPTNVIAKVAVAVGFASFGNKIATQQAANAAAVVLVTQVAADILPIDKWIDTVMGFFSGDKVVEGVVDTSQTRPSARRTVTSNQTLATDGSGRDSMASVLG